MAYGQKHLITGLPQPGTTNLPYGFWTGGGGKFGSSSYLPPYVPVITTVVDTYGSAVIAQTELLSAGIFAWGEAFGGIPGLPSQGTLVSIDAQLANVNTALNRIADQLKSYSDLLHSMDIYVAGLASATSQQNTKLKMSIPSEIQTNNFYKAASGENPELPLLGEQLKIIVQDGILLNNQARSSASFTSYIDKGLAYVSNWITGTSVYKTVSQWLDSIKGAILSPEIPSLESIKVRLASWLGLKDGT